LNNVIDTQCLTLDVTPPGMDTNSFPMLTDSLYDPPRQMGWFGTLQPAVHCMLPITDMDIITTRVEGTMLSRRKGISVPEVCVLFATERSLAAAFPTTGNLTDFQNSFICVPAEPLLPEFEGFRRTAVESVNLTTVYMAHFTGTAFADMAAAADPPNWLAIYTREPSAMLFDSAVLDISIGPCSSGAPLHEIVAPSAVAVVSPPKSKKNKSDTGLIIGLSVAGGVLVCGALVGLGAYYRPWATEVDNRPGSTANPYSYARLPTNEEFRAEPVVTHTTSTMPAATSTRRQFASGDIFANLGE
jgi:hypothetical protein